MVSPSRLADSSRSRGTSTSYPKSPPVVMTKSLTASARGSMTARCTAPASCPSRVRTLASRSTRIVLPPSAEHDCRRRSRRHGSTYVMPTTRMWRWSEAGARTRQPSSGVAACKQLGHDLAGLTGGGARNDVLFGRARDATLIGSEGAVDALHGGDGNWHPHLAEDR